MGLDQYAYIKFQPEYENWLMLAEWRKHPNLQGWMERLWRRKINSSEPYEKDTLMGKIDMYINDLSNATDEAAVSAEIRRYLTFFISLR